MPPSPVPLICLTDPPRERGRQYGATAAACLNRAAEIYLTAVAQPTRSAPDLRALVDTLVPIIERFDRDEAGGGPNENLSSAANQPSHSTPHSAAARNVLDGRVAAQW